MSNKSIKLSPKHGLNPTICTCFYCGNEKNEIALLGRVDKNDTEAPRYACMDYEPCDSCKQQMANGITLIGVEEHPLPDNRPPIQRTPNYDLYPTGSWCVITEDAAKRFLNKTPDILSDVLEKRILFMPHDVLVTLIATKN